MKSLQKFPSNSTDIIHVFEYITAAIFVNLFTLFFSEDAHAQAMVASFCGRSFDDGETNEIAQRIRRATANINVEIETLLEFLTHKGAVG